MNFELRGFPRAAGRFGARNHVFVLPSVVCSGLAAARIAVDGAIAVNHQHGCALVGDDVENSERAFIGMATNPNVGGVVVVSLGCETIQGRRLANRIAERGQRMKFVGIQAEGGTVPSVEKGKEAVAELQLRLSSMARQAAPLSALVIGIHSGPSPLVESLRQTAQDAGAEVICSRTSRAEDQVELAAAGAQIIVSLRGQGEAPMGFAVCPVIAVACDGDLYSALADDFDLDGTQGDPETVAAAIFERVLQVFSGTETASEQRGARDFVLRRLARTM